MRRSGVAARIRVLTGAAVLAATLVSCTHARPATVTPEHPAPGTLLSAPAPLASSIVLQTISSKSMLLRYQSTSGVDGSISTVTASVFVPQGTAPPGGWPIAAIGHPTAGLESSCAPSSYPGLMGNAGTIATFLSFNYLVVMTDYQGLGTPGPHPYLEPKTAAYNVIDSVRAARIAVPEASDAWVAYGVSQGGQAVWAANEFSAQYAPELKLVGSISVAPPTDLTPLVDAMSDGTLTVEQRVLIPTILKGLQVVHPELKLSDYLHGEIERRADVFFGCEGENSELRGMIATRAAPQDFMPTSAEAADQLRTWLGAYTVPSQKSPAPMIVAYGDADKIVLPAWTAQAVQRACALGDTVQEIVAPGQGHGTLNLGSAPADWTAARFAGEPAPSTCAPPV